MDLEERGTRVLGTVGSLHDIGEAELREAWTQHAPAIRHATQGGRFVAVLVGGPTRACAWTPLELTSALSTLAQTLSSDSERLGLAITLSRRSGADVQEAVERWARGRERVYLFDPRRAGAAPNPYLALLGGAEVIAVTADSVAMASEACSTPKPVLTIGEERCRGKLRRFHLLLREACGTGRVEALERETTGAGSQGAEASEAQGQSAATALESVAKGRRGLDDARGTAQRLLPLLLLSAAHRPASLSTRRL